MNDSAIRHALSRDNLVRIAEATKIAPHILQRIIDGDYLPSPEEIDALAGYFRGEYSMTGMDSSWTRRPNPNTTTGPLPLASYVQPADKVKYDPFGAPPMLKKGPKPTGNGALEDGFTGTGQKVATGAKR